MRRVAELVIDLALKDERFFATASAEGVLIVRTDDEKKNHHNGRFFATASAEGVLIVRTDDEKKNHHNGGS